MLRLLAIIQINILEKLIFYFKLLLGGPNAIHEQHHAVDQASSG